MPSQIPVTIFLPTFLNHSPTLEKTSFILSQTLVKNSFTLENIFLIPSQAPSKSPVNIDFTTEKINLIFSHKVLK